MNDNLHDNNMHIITTTSNRILYLENLIESIIHNCNENRRFTHHIIFNGCKKYDSSTLNNYEDNFDVICHETNEFFSLDQILNIYLALLNFKDNDIIIKFDDDVIVRSDDFFTNVECIFDLKPDAVISPFPVGLIHNFGGIQSNDREVIYSESNNIYYTFRKVDHVGGFARMTRAKHYKDFLFTRRNEEDVDFSQNHRHLDFFYLENALIVEHNESILGQKQRIKDKKI